MVTEYLTSEELDYRHSFIFEYIIYGQCSLLQDYSIWQVRPCDMYAGYEDTFTLARRHLTTPRQRSCVLGSRVLVSGAVIPSLGNLIGGTAACHIGRLHL